MKYEEKLSRLRMIRTRNIGPVTFSILINRYGSAINAIDAIPELTKRSGVKATVTSIAEAEAEMEKAAKLSAQIIVKGEDLYPKILLNYDDAPGCLTMRGHPHLIDSTSVAMVGSRNASANAVPFAETLARELTDRGITVVSGLARGIDAACHRGSLEGGTIAVMAGGINEIYPKENARLYKAIAEQGLIITEMPFGMQPTSRLFPIRNRLIASVSLGTVVVEASLRSGSLITARDANERGREVMAIPGNPVDPRSAGCNSLIRDGANLVQNADDIVALLRSPELSARQPELPLSTKANPTDENPKEIAKALEIIAAKLNFEPTEVDELIRQCHLSASVVNIALLELELAGVVERTFGNRVSKVYKP
ncbi:MAG: DNA-processing protein DprA [Alphaproteobacteria bacterium]|nr:DNA-processing protein DprA [Alphaproteobacteria bacterium]